MIDLEKILGSNYNLHKDEDGNKVWYDWEAIKAMKKACLQTVDSCLETIVDEEDKDMQQCVEAIRDNIRAIKQEIG